MTLILNCFRKKSMANKKILYWAADLKPFNNIITKDAKHAYNNFKTLVLQNVTVMVKSLFILNFSNL